MITNDGQPVDVPLHGAGRLYVDVPDLPASERGAVVRLFDEAGLPVTNITGSVEWTRRREGIFRISRLAAGAYRVVVTARDGRTWSQQQVEIRSFEDTEVVLR